MALFKQSPKKVIHLRSTIIWGIYGFIAGFYTCVPLLKAIHREEGSILTEYIKIEDGKTVEIERPRKKS